MFGFGIEFVPSNSRVMPGIRQNTEGLVNKAKEDKNETKQKSKARTKKIFNVNPYKKIHCFLVFLNI